MKHHLIIVAVCYVAVVSGARILVSAPYGTKSHQNMYVPLAKSLAERGHHVTVISNYYVDLLRDSERVRQIVLEELQVDQLSFPDFFETALSSKKIDLKALSQFLTTILSLPSTITRVFYGHQSIKQLIADDQFDLVVISAVYGSVSFPLAWHFKAPMIIQSPNILFTGMASIMGADEDYSYVPFFMSSFSDQMNLFERTVNTIVSVLCKFFIVDRQNSLVWPVVHENVFPDCPPLDEIAQNTSLILLNTHPTLNYPRALPPQVVEAGGLHCRPAQPLPASLEDFVSSDDEGFILFAIGSAIEMTDMPEMLLQSFFKAFARLPHRVIWQWKGESRADIPSNVLPVSWLPQQDLLGHQKCRLFLTHGGLNSIQEAIYHRVPVLGLPFGTDQMLNMKRAVRDGYGLKLDWKEVTEETLSVAINQLLLNSSYGDAIGKLSSLYRDQLETPLERAVYWAEFTLRHNGTHHLRLGSRHLNVFQRNLLDVCFVLLGVFTLHLLLVVFCLQKCCCRKKVLRGARAEKKLQ